MTTFAYSIIHYGIDWFAHSLKSVRDVVDDVYVFYCPQPSFGYRTNLPCPDTRDSFKIVADLYKCKWIDVQPFQSEGQEKFYAQNVCRIAGADVALCLDCDEVWDENYLKRSLEVIKDQPNIRRWRSHFVHFWRSVNWICLDGAWPERFVNFNAIGNEEGYIDTRSGFDNVYHFGYAQRPEIINYKTKIWGHKNEVRPNWFAEKFMAWTPTSLVQDVHPTNVNFWNPQPFDKTLISNLIGNHSYYNMDYII